MLEMIQELLARLLLHAYLSLCHPELRTLTFIGTVLVEETQPKTPAWFGEMGAGSRSVNHLSIPLPISPSLSLLPHRQTSLPHRQPLTFFFLAFLLVSSYSFSFILCSFFHSQSLQPLLTPHLPPPSSHLPVSPLVSSELLRISSQLHSLAYFVFQPW